MKKHRDVLKSVTDKGKTPCDGKSQLVLLCPHTLQLYSPMAYPVPALPMSPCNSPASKGLGKGTFCCISRLEQIRHQSTKHQNWSMGDRRTIPTAVGVDQKEDLFILVTVNQYQTVSAIKRLLHYSSKPRSYIPPNLVCLLFFQYLFSYSIFAKALQVVLQPLIFIFSH